MFWIPKEAAFTVLGFSLIGLSWVTSNSKYRTFKNKWLGLILIYSALSFGWFFYKPLVFSNDKVVWNLWNIRPTINIILGLLLIQVFVEYTDNLRRWLKTAEVLCWLAFGFAVYGIIQYCNLDQLFSGNFSILYTEGVVEAKIRMVTFLGQHSLTANFLAVISPLCLMFKQLRYKVIYLILFFAICLADSVLSIAAFVLGLLVYLLLTKNYKILGFLIALIIGGLLFTYHKSPGFFGFEGRFDVWNKILEGCKNSFITGKGLGSLAAQQYKIANRQLLVLSAHSEPLQMLFEGGLIMFFLCACYLVSLFRRFIVKEKTMLLIGYTSAFLSYLIISLGNYPLRIAPLALIFILYIAGLEAQLIKGE